MSRCAHEGRRNVTRTSNPLGDIESFIASTDFSLPSSLPKFRHISISIIFSPLYDSIIYIYIFLFSYNIIRREKFDTSRKLLIFSKYWKIRKIYVNFIEIMFFEIFVSSRDVDNFVTETWPSFPRYREIKDVAIV